MESNAISEEIADMLTDFLKSSHDGLKSAMNENETHRIPFVIQQMAINSVMNGYMKRIYSYMKFDWSYPLNRAYCFLFPKLGIIKMRDLLKEMNNKVEEVKGL